MSGAERNFCSVSDCLEMFHAMFIVKFFKIVYTTEYLHIEYYHKEYLHLA